jgi:hypothetical protein
LYQSRISVSQQAARLRLAACQLVSQNLRTRKLKCYLGQRSVVGA